MGGFALYRSPAGVPVSGSVLLFIQKNCFSIMSMKGLGSDKLYDQNLSDEMGRREVFSVTVQDESAIRAVPLLHSPSLIERPFTPSDARTLYAPSTINTSQMRREKGYGSPGFGRKASVSLAGTPVMAPNGHILSGLDTLLD